MYIFIGLSYEVYIVLSQKDDSNAEHLVDFASHKLLYNIIYKERETTLNHREGTFGSGIYN